MWLQLDLTTDSSQSSLVIFYVSGQGMVAGDYYGTGEKGTMGGWKGKGNLFPPSHDPTHFPSPSFSRVYINRRLRDDWRHFLVSLELSMTRYWTQRAAFSLENWKFANAFVSSLLSWLDRSSTLARLQRDSFRRRIKYSRCRIENKT